MFTAWRQITRSVFSRIFFYYAASLTVQLTSSCDSFTKKVLANFGRSVHVTKRNVTTTCRLQWIKRCGKIFNHACWLVTTYSTTTPGTIILSPTLCFEMSSENIKTRNVRSTHAASVFSRNDWLNFIWTWVLVLMIVLLIEVVFIFPCASFFRECLFFGSSRAINPEVRWDEFLLSEQSQSFFG